MGFFMYVHESKTFVIKAVNLQRKKHYHYIQSIMKANCIHILDKNTVSQMAAGEVVCRPANVVKELVENSIDAGAKHITINIRQGGKGQILVVDDGCGMNSEDAELAFHKHATSKISSLRDLTDNLHTNGFRGEALPSIASVATVTLKTRQGDEELGTCIVYNEGTLVKQEEVACTKGTSVEVSNLFAPVPARRRFLKKDSIEARHCIDTFIRIALIYTGVEFEFFNEGMKLYHLHPCTMQERISDIYDKKYDGHLIPLHCDSECCSITGYIGSPCIASCKNCNQLFFVNGRYAENVQLRRAIYNGYDQLVQKGTKTPFFLHIMVNPKEVDVNASPSKREVVFENENSIWAALTVSVRESLYKDKELPILDFKSQDKEVNIHLDTPTPTHGHLKKYVPQVTIQPEPTQMMLFGVEKCVTSTKSQPVQNFMQYQGTYIITTTLDGIIVINQERASARIQYEHFMTRLANYEEAEQGELFEDFCTDSHNSETQEEMIHRIAMTKARRNGIAGGQILNETEMKTLYSDLMACRNSRFTPTGEAIYSIIPIDKSIV